MSLFWNEIKTLANILLKNGMTNFEEDAKAKAFWDGFFNMFSIKKCSITCFKSTLKYDGKGNYVDFH